MGKRTSKRTSNRVVVEAPVEAPVVEVPVEAPVVEVPVVEASALEHEWERGLVRKLAAEGFMDVAELAQGWPPARLGDFVGFVWDLIAMGLVGRSGRKIGLTDRGSELARAVLS